MSRGKTRRAARFLMTARRHQPKKQRRTKESGVKAPHSKKSSLV
jgi:hypothetical protein